MHFYYRSTTMEQQPCGSHPVDRTTGNTSTPKNHKKPPLETSFGQQKRGKKQIAPKQTLVGR